VLIRIGGLIYEHWQRPGDTAQTAVVYVQLLRVVRIQHGYPQRMAYMATFIKWQVAIDKTGIKALQ